jgi:hypothetical protein
MKITTLILYNNSLKENNGMHSMVSNVYIMRTFPFCIISEQ